MVTGRYLYPKVYPQTISLSCWQHNSPSTTARKHYALQYRKAAREIIESNWLIGTPEWSQQTGKDPLMRAVRWIEAISGILATVAGGVAIMYLLTAPTYSGEGCQATSSGEPPICVTRTATLVQINGATAIIDLSIAVVLFACIAISAVIHSRTGGRSAQRVLWGSTAVLIIFTLLAILSIGPRLLPGAALALVASLCALVWPLIHHHRADGMTSA